MASLCMWGSSHSSIPACVVSVPRAIFWEPGYETSLFCGLVLGTQGVVCHAPRHCVRGILTST